MEYRLIAYYPRDWLFLIRAHWGYHDTELLLLAGKTGKAIILDDVPHYSPSGRGLVAISAAEVDGYKEKSIEIISFLRGEPKIAWRYRVTSGRSTNS